MTLRTVKLSPGHQVYFPSEVLEEAGIGEGESFLVRVRGGIIELIPELHASRALDEGLRNIREASLAHLERQWDNPEDEAWNEA